jgi:hypothetical protein
MEFLKRLCTARYGIYAEKTPTPIGGQVHVYGVARDGRVCRYGGKGRKDVAQVVESVRAKHLALTSRDADLKGRELYGLPPEPGTTA